MNNLIVVGIDYSMTSPAITVHTGDIWAYENCKFFFLTAKKKYIIANGQYTSCLHEEFVHNEHRFDNISSWAIKQIVHTANVFIEDYAYAATGRVFGIGENGGLLKHKLWKDCIRFTLVPPTVVKKFGSGKGNANKFAMHEAFVKETGIDVSKILVGHPGESPSADIVDSYYIAKYGFNQLQIKKSH